MYKESRKLYKNSNEIETLKGLSDFKKRSVQ